MENFQCLLRSSLFFIQREFSEWNVLIRQVIRNYSIPSSFAFFRFPNRFTSTELKITQAHIYFYALKLRVRAHLHNVSCRWFKLHQSTLLITTFLPFRRIQQASPLIKLCISPSDHPIMASKVALHVMMNLLFVVIREMEKAGSSASVRSSEAGIRRRLN